MIASAGAGGRNVKEAGCDRNVIRAAKLETIAAK